MHEFVDAIVVGAGIAGLAVGSELARTRGVVVLDAAAAPATRATARSASSWIVGYGRESVAPFTRASRAWFEGTDGGGQGSLLSRRGLLLVAGRADATRHETAVAAGARAIDAATACVLFPALRPDAVVAAAYEPDTYDIQTLGAVGAFSHALRSRGGQLRTEAPAREIVRSGGVWVIATPAATYETALIVNAAGAWADEVAGLAGVPKLGLSALRRTACTFEAPTGMEPDGWPLLMDADEHFYVKPHGERTFLASPADETLLPPGDTMPDPDDVALALERVASATSLAPRTIRSSWAGLRTFAPDRAPVLGPDPAADGFAWFAGLGGFGVMSAPAMARAVVDLIERGRLPADVVAFGGRLEHVAPDRLRA